MVYAHNIPIRDADYEELKARWIDPATWANSIEEYTYTRGWWTEAFRYFIKGAVGLSENYDAASPPAIKGKIDDFVSRIAYLNFIQELVLSDSQMANATQEQIESSKHINRDILKILKITHCICWGSPTYNYVKGINNFSLKSETDEGKRGFSSCILNTDLGYDLNVLRIHHPSMPNFDAYSEYTQRIISKFIT